MRTIWGSGVRRAALGACVLAAAACGGSDEARPADEAPAATPGLAGAANDSAGGAMRSGDPSDVSVASIIALIDRAEVESSELAAQRASNPEVKRYAQEMIAAHQSAAGTQPAATMTTGESDLTALLQQAHTGAMNRLRTLAAGAEFDRAYMTSQIEAHEGAHQTLERMRAAARDDALTERIQQKMAAVQQHLGRARTIQQALGAS